ncbi:MAG: transglutaminase domain-containing protein [Chitinophagaceae bacterium]|nr:transglutaminase domain-containing protein [Chitinophagaceae bacterium]
MKRSHLVFIFLLGFAACSRTNSLSLTPAQETAIHYLYQSSLLTDTFSRVLWQVPVDFRGIDIAHDSLYFIFKITEDRARILNRVALDTTKVEFANCPSGDCQFGGLQGRIDGYAAFRMRTDNLKVDTQQVLHCLLKKDSLSLRFNDFMQEMDTNICYHTPKYLDLSAAMQTKSYSISIGSFISRKGKDRVIRKLVDSLCKGLTTVEDKAQILLDYVTNNIAYSYEDFWYDTEITKRAHEVLYSGEADCSGMSTLLASLYEEAGVPYCLLYFKNHMNIGVAGKFVPVNRYTVDIKGKTWYFAETTTPGFVIGQTRLSNDEIYDAYLFYHIPYESEFVMDGKTHQPLAYVDLEEEE